MGYGPIKILNSKPVNIGRSTLIRTTAKTLCFMKNDNKKIGMVSKPF